MKLSYKKQLQFSIEKWVFISVCSFILNSCGNENRETIHFNYPLYEPCMLLNYEQDNRIEGTYFKVSKINLQDSTIKFNMPINFYLNESNIKNWNIGWGTNVPLYDAGNENLGSIIEIDTTNHLIKLGKLKQGNTLPKEGERIVFWNSEPSGFINELKRPIINTSLWPTFSNKSIAFSSIEFDSSLSKWVMLFHECDNDFVQIYAATSLNLVDWEPGNDAKPILTSANFNDCTWVLKNDKGEASRTPYISDIFRHNNKWYIFLDCFDNDNKRHIGIGISETNLLGPYKISKSPILSPGQTGTWNDKAVFYAKVRKYNDKFILLFDGQNQSEYERVGIAFSNDLIHWTQATYNPVLDQHTGWRSAVTSTEPNNVIIKNDSIFLSVSGVKKAKAGPWNHYITKKMYMDVSGNVFDAQLGVFVSTDSGRSFLPHKNNPIFVNNYADTNENDHIGGNFKFIQTDTADFIIYQAKSKHNGHQYNIMERVKRK